MLKVTPGGGPREQTSSATSLLKGGDAVGVGYLFSGSRDGGAFSAIFFLISRVFLGSYCL